MKMSEKSKKQADASRENEQSRRAFITKGSLAAVPVVLTLKGRSAAANSSGHASTFGSPRPQRRRG